MFIHTHFSHLSEIVSGEQGAPVSHQEKRLVVDSLLSYLTHLHLHPTSFQVIFLWFYIFMNIL